MLKAKSSCLWILKVLFSMATALHAHRLRHDFRYSSCRFDSLGMFLGFQGKISSMKLNISWHDAKGKETIVEAVSSECLALGTNWVVFRGTSGDDGTTIRCSKKISKTLHDQEFNHLTFRYDDMLPPYRYGPARAMFNEAKPVDIENCELYVASEIIIVGQLKRKPLEVRTSIKDRLATFIAEMMGNGEMHNYLFEGNVFWQESTDKIYILGTRYVGSPTDEEKEAYKDQFSCENKDVYDFTRLLSFLGCTAPKSMKTLKLDAERKQSSICTDPGEFLEAARAVTCK
eukprot:TRINITY_DN45611_c0_g1_i1.p1 TRINITY_DN45611_c0_g1~~TRINITY_DN45611_c0_g1_i1.p1  ORF type:complete len:287 (-),score=6.70 TRINITY_DN45611_c0_g1_i1:136-996(-)